MGKKEIVHDVVFNDTFCEAFDNSVKPVLLDTTSTIVKNSKGTSKIFTLLTLLFSILL